MAFSTAKCLAIKEVSSKLALLKMNRVIANAVNSFYCVLIQLLISLLTGSLVLVLQSRLNCWKRVVRGSLYETSSSECHILSFWSCCLRQS
jgi:accessory gene regulator protein AgrB